MQLLSPINIAFLVLPSQLLVIFKFGLIESSRIKIYVPVRIDFIGQPRLRRLLHRNAPSRHFSFAGALWQKSHSTIFHVSLIRGQGILQHRRLHSSELV